jgi:hypothetical protein
MFPANPLAGFFPSEGPLSDPSHKLGFFFLPGESASNNSAPESTAASSESAIATKGN